MRKAVFLLALVACQSLDVSRQLGARCDLNAECDGKCLAAPAWPGGMCTTICDSDASCPDRAACIDEQGGICAFRCTTDPDCGFLGPGYTCQTVDRHGMTGQSVHVCHG